MAFYLLIAHHFYTKKKALVTKTKIINRDDIVSLILAGVSVIVVLLGTLNGGSVSSQLLRFYTTGDGTTHLSITMSVYDAQSYIYGPVNKDTEMAYRGSSAYPQGWHLVGAVLFHGISDNLKLPTQPTQIMLLFFGFIMLWFFLILFFASQFVLWMLRKYIAQPKNSLLYTVSTLTVVSLEALLLFSCFRYGFYNYFGLICYLIVIVHCGAWMINREFDSRITPLIYGILLGITTAFTWSLAAPIGLFFTGLTLLWTFRNWREVFKWIMKYKIRLAIMFLLVATTIAQVYVLAEYATDKGLISTQNSGGIWPLNYGLLAAMLAISLWWLATKFNKTDSISVPLIVSLISFGGFSSIIALYELATGNSLSYYFIKLFSLTFMILILFIGVLAGIMLHHIVKKNGQMITIIIAILAFLITPLAVGYDFEGVKYAAGNRRLVSPELATNLVEIMKKPYIYNDNVFVYYNDNYNKKWQNYTATRFMNMLSGLHGVDEGIANYLAANLASSPSKSLDAIKDYAQSNPGKRFYVITQNSEYPTIHKTLGKYGNVDIIAK